MSCNKCRQAARHQSDSWCLGCAAWEQVGAELSSSWNSPGARLIATDLLVSTLRQIRAVRRLGQAGAGTRLAQPVKEEEEGHPGGKGHKPEALADSSRAPGLKAAAKSSSLAGRSAPKQPETDDECEEYTEEEESPQDVKGRSPLARVRQDEKSSSKRGEDKRKEREEEPADRARSRQRSRGRGRRRRQNASEETSGPNSAGRTKAPEALQVRKESLSSTTS